MKYYKDYEIEKIGYSDYATLIMVGCREDGLSTRLLSFGSDGDYKAYLVDEEAKIGEHYHLVAEFSYWLKIYDDEGLRISLQGSRIKIYRAGCFGCIIQVIK